MQQHDERVGRCVRLSDCRINVSHDGIGRTLRVVCWVPIPERNAVPQIPNGNSLFDLYVTVWWANKARSDAKPIKDDRRR